MCAGLGSATVQLQPRTGARDDDDDDDDGGGGDDDVTTQLSLKCLTDGRPTPGVEWLRNYIRSVTRLSISRWVESSRLTSATGSPHTQPVFT